MKFKNVLLNIVDGIVNIVIMIIGFIMFGIKCFIINCVFVVFNVWDVNIYFWFFNFKICLWIICDIFI